MPNLFDVTVYPAQFSWRQAYWTAAVACLGYARSFPFSALWRLSYGVNAVRFLPPASALNNGIAIVEFDNITYVGIEGTATWQQWGRYLDEFGDQPILEPGMRASNYFAIDGLDCFRRIQAALTPGKPFVLCGHSLGGAAAVIASKAFKQAGRSPLAVWTFGCPKPGNIVLAEGLDVPTFRVFGTNDPVPFFPPKGLYVLWGPTEASAIAHDPVHVGLPIECGSLDFGGIFADVTDELREFGSVKAEGMVAAHFMGTYTEALWYRLSPSERGGLIDVFDALTELRAQGVPNWPLQIDFGGSPPQSREEVYADEVDELRRVTAVPSNIEVRLFTNAEDVSTYTSPSQFIEPAFPGYEVARVVERLTPVAGPFGSPETTESALRFRLTQNIDPGVTVRGAYATIRRSDGTPTWGGTVTFWNPVNLLTREDYVDVAVKLSCVKVT